MALPQLLWEDGDGLMVSLFALIGLVFMVCVIGQKRIERVLPAVLCLWMLPLTVLAALNKLAWVDALSVGMLVAQAVVLILWLLRVKLPVLGQRIRTYLLTPGFAVFLILAGVLYYCCEPMVVWWADDVFYWALEPKALWYLGGFTDSLGSLAGVYATYTPGMPLIQWQFMHFVGEYRESILYYALFLSYCIFLLPLCERITWKQWWAVPIAAVSLIVLPLLSNALAYTFLSVDTALAACFAFALLTVNEDKPDPFALVCALCGLTLLKQVGIFLCALVLLFAWLRHRADQKQPTLPVQGAVSFGKLALWWVFPAATALGWVVVCSVVGLSGVHAENTVSGIASVFSGQFQLPPNFDVMPAAFWYALTHAPTTERLLTALPLIPLSKLVCLLLLFGATLLLARIHGKQQLSKLLVFALLATVFYVLLILGGFAFTFGSEIASYSGAKVNNLSLLLERYLSPLMLGVGSLVFYYVLAALLDAKRSLVKRALTGGILLILTVFCVNWASIGETLLPSGYQTREDTLSVADFTAESNFWADSLDCAKDTAVLVGFSNDSVFMSDLNYTYAPARMLLPIRYKGDVEKLISDLRNRHADYIVCLDDANDLYNTALELTPDQYLDTYTLYKVLDDGDTVTLEAAE